MKKSTLKGAMTAAAMLLLAGSANAQQVFYESFDGLTTSEGGNDGFYDNSDAPDATICEEDLTDATLLDNKEGWGDFVAIAQGKQCIRISSKKNSGSITTPLIELNGADATLTFNAAGYSTDAATLYVKVVGDDAQLTYDGVTASEIAISLPVSDKATTVLADQKYTVGISGCATGVRLAFSTISSNSDKQRAFLDEIRVVKDSANGILSVSDQRPQQGNTYTIDGRQLKLTPSCHGLYIKDGKKIAL